MAAQPLILVEYGGADAGTGRRPAKSYPRQQSSWNQLSTATAPALAERKPLPPSIDPQSATEGMPQAETGVSTPFTKDWSAILAGIDQLAAGAEDEVKATEYAYTTARALLDSVYPRLKTKRPGNIPQIVPEHSITTDDVGGIRLAWHLGPRHVRVNLGANNNLRSYIYFESGPNHGIEELNPQHLAGRLVWLTEK